MTDTIIQGLLEEAACQREAIGLVSIETTHALAAEGYELAALYSDTDNIINERNG